MTDWLEMSCFLIRIVTDSSPSFPTVREKEEIFGAKNGITPSSLPSTRLDLDRSSGKDFTLLGSRAAPSSEFVMPSKQEALHIHSTGHSRTRRCWEKALRYYVMFMFAPQVSFSLIQSCFSLFCD